MSASGAELVATWASVAASLGTVGAFAIAGLVVFREARRDRLEKERVQASRVAAWLQVVNGDDRRLRRTYTQRRIIALVLRNGSDLPVYDTQLWWALRSGEHDVKDMGVLPPNTEIATGLFAEKRPDDWIVATGTTFVDTAGRPWTGPSRDCCCRDATSRRGRYAGNVAPRTRLPPTEPLRTPPRRTRLPDETSRASRATRRRLGGFLAGCWDRRRLALGQVLGAFDVDVRRDAIQPMGHPPGVLAE